MSTDIRPLTPIRMTDLFDGRLEKAGVHEHHSKKVTANQKCLTDSRNFLWVYGDEKGLVLEFSTYGMNATERILAAIAVEFDVDLVSEHDPEFWGFETQEEWDAAMAGDLAIARWPRGADVATIARSILGTLKYKPHTNDTTALRRALESVIDHAQCCDHCGQPATAADPLSPYDWQGRPDGIWLHRQCEARWFDSHEPAPVSAPDPTPERRLSSRRVQVALQPKCARRLRTRRRVASKPA